MLHLGSEKWDINHRGHVQGDGRQRHKQDPSLQLDSSNEELTDASAKARTNLQCLTFLRFRELYQDEYQNQEEANDLQVV
jgi:hypothetical protein